MPVSEDRIWWSRFTDSYVCNNPKAGSTLWRDRAGKSMGGGDTYAKSLSLEREKTIYKGKYIRKKEILGEMPNF